MCCHPALSPASAIALTLRAVGGLTTAEIADAFLVPQATMAQRISRAKATIKDVPFDSPGDLALVLRVLYLIFHEGHRTKVDLAAEAIRLTRQLALASREPEVRGLLALMLLHRARDAARWRDGRLVPLDRQDRSLWDTAEIAEGVALLQSALADDRPGEYQLQAAIAALHDDAASWEETDWVQLLGWYGDLVALAGNPVARLSRLVPLAHVDGAGRGARRARPARGGVAARSRSSMPCTPTCSSWPATGPRRRTPVPGPPASRPVRPSATTSPGARPSSDQVSNRRRSR